MKTYKNLQALKKRCIKNNGKPVEVFDDQGIKVNGKIYRQMEYGNMGRKFTGNCYVTFRNTGRRGEQPTYANRQPIGLSDSFITIEYHLRESSPDQTVFNLFEFVCIRETY